MALPESSVTRGVDLTGDEIKVFQDGTTLIQAMAVTDEAGDHSGIAANPIHVQGSVLNDIRTSLQTLDDVVSGSTLAVTEDNSAAIQTAVEAVNTALQSSGVTHTQLAAIQTAVQLLDNFISGSRGLVTEDNSAAILTAVQAVQTSVQALDNAVSGSRLLVTEDNSASIQTAVEAINTAFQAAGVTNTQLAAIQTAVQLLDNAVSTLTKAGTFVTDGTDGKISYTSVSGDLDTVGNWSLQVHIVTPAGSWKSDIGTFRVHANL